MQQVLARSNGRVLCIAWVADNPWTRSRGLLGGSALPVDHGLWIKPCSSVHTFFMRFPIDVVYLAADGTVTKTAGPLLPFRVSAGGGKARSVLELPAGSVQRMSIVIGEKLVMEPVSAQSVRDT